MQYSPPHSINIPVERNVGLANRAEPSSAMNPSRKAQKREKLPILLGLLFTNAIAIYLVQLKRENWTGPLSLTNLIAANPTGVGIAVQVISHLLGLINLTALCIALNLTARAQLASRSLKLESLRLLNALSLNRIDWSFQNMYLVLTIVFVTFNMLPAAFWAGAITPAMVNVAESYNLMVPEYSNGYGLLASDIVFSNSSFSRVEERGTFTFFPQRDFMGYILGNAREAISTSGGVSLHAKLDKSGYLYTTRSFGVASTVGLTDTFPIPALAYQFHETGFKSSANCIYNDSSLVWLQKLDIPAQVGLSFNIYNTRACFPSGFGVDSKTPCGATAATAMVDAIAFTMATAWGNTSDSNYGNYVGLAASGGDSRNISTSHYAALNNIQCQVFFEPYDFLVTVNTTSKSIAVVPQNATEPFPNGPYLAAETMWRLGDLATTIVMTQWTSVLGDMFLNNVAIASMNSSSNATILYGVGTAIESMIDNILQATSAAQLMIAQGNQTVTAETQVSSFVLGSSVYTYGILALNLLVTLIFIIELTRTRMWCHAPRFDFSDVTAVILYASAPNNGIAGKARIIGHSTASRSLDSVLGKMSITVVDTVEGKKLQIVGRSDTSLVPKAPGESPALAASSTTSARSYTEDTAIEDNSSSS